MFVGVLMGTWQVSLDWEHKVQKVVSRGTEGKKKLCKALGGTNRFGGGRF